MRLYVVVTNDTYELPVALGSSYKELEVITGIKKSTINKSVMRGNTINDRKWKCIKVDV